MPHKSGKHLSFRARFLIGLEKVSTDIANITAETKKIRLQLTDYQNGLVGSPTTILQRIDTLRNHHNRLKEQLDCWLVWFDQLTERGELKDSILVPKKYYAREVKGQLRAFCRQWKALQRELMGIEAELKPKDGGDVDTIQVIG